MDKDGGVFSVVEERCFQLKKVGRSCDKHFRSGLGSYLVELVVDALKFIERE